MTSRILLLLVAGVFLSALFSGSETGFYRVTRVRLLLDGLGGDVISRMLLRLTNHPALFVATSLIGNNMANYLTSLGIVLVADRLFTDAPVVEILAPMVLSPVVFVYCELLPKQLFYHAPNRLLRRSGPLLLLFVVLFAPIAMVLWVLAWLLERVLGQTPLRVRLTLARKELQQLLVEGEEAGILHTAQRNLAQQLLAYSTGSVAQFVIPPGRAVSVPRDASTREALNVARRQNAPVLLVRHPRSRQFVGYVRAIDLRLSRAERVESLLPLPRLHRTESYLDALLQLRAAKAEVGLVEDRHHNPVGVLYARHVTETLLDEA